MKPRLRCVVVGLVSGCVAPVAQDDSSPSDTPGVVLGCAEGMSAVTDEDHQIAFCMDAYEVVVSALPGDAALGDPDQWTDDAVVPTATASSSAAVVPSFTISFDQAVAICANTPVYGPEGQVAGHKRLPTAEEWEDAADGVLGPGGLNFPYGDELDLTACAMAVSDADGEPVYSETQPTGSLSRCVSPFGTYDQLGNVWEWADPELQVDTTAWFETAAAAGLVMSVDEEGRLVSEGEIAETLEIHAAHVLPNSFARGEDGTLRVEATWGGPEGRPPGYLVVGIGELTATPERWLPIELMPIDPEASQGEGWVVLRPDQDGTPFTHKRGCSYYVGEPQQCTNSVVFWDHHHDFRGTVGFRCASDPVEVED